MPDTSADWGFSPTARTSRPHRVRYSSHHAAGIIGYTRYRGHGWLKRASPIRGISDTPGISNRWAALVTGWMLVLRKLAMPSTRVLRASPTTNWLAVSRWLMLACTDATMTPMAEANISPTVTDSVRCIPSAPAKAPPRTIPSSEMLRVPAFSAMVSPMAAKASSAAKRMAPE